MDIIYKKSEGINITSGKNTKILIAKDYKYSGNDFSIVLADDFNGEGFNIKLPGEYEVKEVSIIAQSSLNGHEIDIVEFMVDDISVVFIKSQFKYSKSIHDNLGEVDVLIASIEDNKSFEDMLNKFDPEIFVPVGDKETVDQMIKNTNLSKLEEKNKLKLNRDQFGSEDFILECVLIDR